MYCERCSDTNSARGSRWSREFLQRECGDVIRRQLLVAWTAPAFFPRLSCLLGFRGEEKGEGHFVSFWIVDHTLVQGERFALYFRCDCIEVGIVSFDSD